MTTILDDATYRLSSWWYNGDNHRTYPATLASRTPGFTESWGRDEDEEGKELPSWFAMEQNQLGLVLQQPYPQAPITLFQYHVAWDIQWALRDAKVDFVVVNVPHAFSEATGPLPAWNDLTEPERPILLGHSQQGIFDLWLNVETLAPCVGPRDARSVGNHDKYNPWDTWHRWRFGGTFYPASTRAEAKTAETLKLQQDYRHQDQLWWSAVTAASLVSIGVTQWIVSMTTLSASASK
jgi:hypothetical protein